MKEIQHTNVAFQFKSIKLNEKENIAVIEGIANQVGIIDWGLDFTDPGAFDKTVKENPVVPALRAHMSWEIPVGLNFLSVADDGSLLTRMELNLEVQSAKEHYALLKQFHEAGRPFELSIGFLIMDSDIEDRKGVEVRVLKEVKVEEVSLVVFGMNPGSQVTDVKTKEMETKITDLEKSNVKNEEEITDLNSQLKEKDYEIGLLKSKLKTQKIIGGYNE